MYPPTQLAALAAVVDGGTFEAAARDLHLTASAVSQRMRALEDQVGQVLVTRTTPCRATDAGQVVLTLARQTALLTAETTARLGGDAGVRRAAVAVNADSLATWFRAVLAEAAGWDGVAMEVHVADQDRTTGLLRAGHVLGAVTSESTAVQGCSVTPLGAMRYHPIAAATLVERLDGAGGTDGRPALDRLDWERMPLVQFDGDDALQHDWLAARGHPRPSVVHRVPTTADLAAAVRCGLGWGMMLDGQLGDDVATGRLVRLASEPVVVRLHWQRWRLDSPLLEALTTAVLTAAR